mgnify:CR=1 FL=1
MKDNFKLLQNEDVYEICEFLKEINPFVSKKNFKDPYLIKNDFDDTVVKNTLFSYSRLYFARVIKNKIQDICIFECTQYPSTVRSVTLKFSNNINSEGEELIRYSLEVIKNLFEEHNKFIVNVRNVNYQNMIDFIEGLKLSREQILINEFGKNNDLLVYSKLIKEVENEE